MVRLILTVLAALWLALPLHAAPVTVFAAASMKGALDEVAAAYREQTGEEMRLSFAGSSALARQIDAGAPADVFVSANTDWVDWLEGRDLVRRRIDLLENRLVLIGPAEATAGGMDRLGSGDERVAMALVDAVPAGIYGRAALEKLALWDRVAPRVVQADNVRAALALVALGEAPLGIVYATDALAEPRVKVLAEFPPGSHPPIRYPGAAITQAGEPVLDFLASEAAREIFARYGFGLVD